MPVTSAGSSANEAAEQTPRLSGGDARAAKKELTRIERRVEKLQSEEGRIHALMAEAATDHSKITALDAELRQVIAEREALEEEWLDVAANLE